MGEEVMARPLVYIAGPFRAHTPWGIEHNIRRAEAHGLFVAELGGIPIIPHTMYRFFDKLLSDAFWLEAGITLLQTCAAVAVCVDEDRAQESAGTVSEIGEARLRGLSVFYDNEEQQTHLASWIRIQTGRIT
jgi:hypothetical protein